MINDISKESHTEKIERMYGNDVHYIVKDVNTNEVKQVTGLELKTNFNQYTNDIPIKDMLLVGLTKIFKIK